MSVDNERVPYFSKTFKISDIISPKNCLGMKKRTIEVTIGNSEKARQFMNPKDVADIQHQNLKEMALELFKITDEIALERGFKFIDQQEWDEK